MELGLNALEYCLENWEKKKEKSSLLYLFQGFPMEKLNRLKLFQTGMTPCGFQHQTWFDKVRWMSLPSSGHADETDFSHLLLLPGGNGCLPVYTACPVSQMIWDIKGDMPLSCRQTLCADFPRKQCLQISEAQERVVVLLRPLLV